jgi:glutamate dehydrogenase/leucine dehydrogenase
LWSCASDDHLCVLDKRVCLSGSGNVSTFCAQKLIACGAKVVTLSDTSGFALNMLNDLTRDCELTEWV